jgi:outer membrane protein assembly factor BamE (lipoprotein component of BamABCDE complex)
MSRVDCPERDRGKHPVIGFILASLLLLSSGCMTAGPTGAGVAAAEEEMTLGNVQRRIDVGMSSADVVERIGSPNIVTTDADRNEVWVYDRFATEARYESTSLGLGLLIGGFGSSSGGLGGVGASRSRGSQSRTQRTLTVVIRFDADHLVRSLAYHASRF